MSFYELNFHRSKASGAYSQEPPITLPVVYDGTKVALAIYREPHYSFNLPDELGCRIESGELKPVFVFSGIGNPASFEYKDGYSLASITLLLAADYELDLLKI